MHLECQSINIHAFNHKNKVHMIFPTLFHVSSKAFPSPDSHKVKFYKIYPSRDDDIDESYECWIKWLEMNTGLTHTLNAI